jgi:phage tail sheath protein FI
MTAVISPSVSIQKTTTDGSIQISFESNNTLQIKVPKEGTTAEKIIKQWNASADNTAARFFKLTLLKNKGQLTENTYKTHDINKTTKSLSNLKSTDTELYNQAKKIIESAKMVLPPSGAIAGVYAKVDRERGVWKAPANVSLSAVIEPTIKLTDQDQESLNVHTTGKSINAIRTFTGKGTLVWGSRTLAGNDNEWRYVPVRRLFNMIEESVKKASAFAVFEPNTEMTWLKVRVMIQNYLDDLWKKGGLAGGSPAEAYFVNVGLGTTMSSQDILEGRMIVEIGVAAVRPAEFIILRFSHLVQGA